VRGPPLRTEREKRERLSANLTPTFHIGTAARKCLIRRWLIRSARFCSKPRRYCCPPTVGKCRARRGMSRWTHECEQRREAPAPARTPVVSFHEVFSMRATILAVMATFGLLALQGRPHVSQGLIRAAGSAALPRS